MPSSERGENVTLGPFQFRTPDRPCRVGDCEEKADGVVDLENATINACIYCAPQFLQHEGNEWTPLAGGRTLHTGGENDLDSDDKRWIEGRLRKCRFVQWDRFTAGEDPHNSGEMIIDIYGWIDRADDYKDFAHVTFFTVNQSLSFTTSSDEYSMELHQCLTGEEPETHHECQRVEHTFNVSNAIETVKSHNLEDFA